MPFLFLSPSLQPFNEYAGGGNEQFYMNRIADYMEPLLIANGIQYKRNNIDTNLRTSINESNSGNYDLHLALHSNASAPSMAGTLRGTDVYYRTGSSKGARAAEIIADNFRKISPTPNLVKAIATSELSELNLTKAPAVLIETAYHDNLSDALWIKNNLYNIAKNIVQSLTIYFGIPFNDNVFAPYVASVDVNGSTLNLRSRPDMSAPVIYRLPDNSKVLVLGRTGDWLIVNFPVPDEDSLYNGSFTQGIVGYVYSAYIRTP